MISIQLKGPKGIEKLSMLPIEIKNQLFKGMGEAALLIQKTSREKYLSGPYPSKLTSDSGNLSKGVWAYTQLGGMAGEFGRIHVRSDARSEKGIHYSSVHEQSGGQSGGPLAGAIGFGFPIFAKSKKGMTFFWKRRGFWVHGAQMVIIPPRPFLWPAILDNIEKIRLLLNRTILQAYKNAKAKGGTI